jgi:multiple sugar transport system substrate-binding protein
MTTTRRGLSLLLVAGLGLVAASCGSDDGNKPAAGGASDGPVTITVGCEPPKSNPKEREAWEADVATFQKAHPNITVQGKDAFPCINPDTFQA